MNVPTQTASESPSARQGCCLHVPTCRTNPRLHYPRSGGVKKGEKKGFAGGGEKQDIVKFGQLGNALKRFVIAMLHGKIKGCCQSLLTQNLLGDEESLMKMHAAVQALGCQLFRQPNS